MDAECLTKLANVEKTLQEMLACVEQAEKDADELDQFVIYGIDQADHCLQELAECRRKLEGWADHSLS
jgi:Mg2+ and Co2+ transporter CorA